MARPFFQTEKQTKLNFFKMIILANLDKQQAKLRSEL